MFLVMLAYHALISFYVIGTTLSKPSVNSEDCKVSSYVTVPGPTVTVYDFSTTSSYAIVYTTVKTFVRTYRETLTIETAPLPVMSTAQSQPSAGISATGNLSTPNPTPSSQVNSFSSMLPVYTQPIHRTTSLYSTVTHITIGSPLNTHSMQSALTLYSTVTDITVVTHTSVVPSVLPVHTTQNKSDHFTTTRLSTAYTTDHLTSTTKITIIRTLTRENSSGSFTPTPESLTTDKTQTPASSNSYAFPTYATGYPRAKTTAPSLSQIASTSPGSPSPSNCGEYGNFTLNWDDEPSYNPGHPKTAPYPPVFNPYHQFFFSNGYAYVPNFRSAYKAVSPPQMAIFFPNSTEDQGSPYAAGGRPGEVGAGPRASLNAFWFNAYSVYLGCDDGGPEGCTMAIKGFKWNNTVQREVLTAQHIVTLPPCIGLRGCQMKFVDFGSSFTSLSGIQVFAAIKGVPRIFFMDNLRMGWYNNSCAAGLYRLTQRR